MSIDADDVDYDLLLTRAAIDKGADHDAKIEHMLNLETRPQMVHVRCRGNRLELVINIERGQHGERSLKLPDEIMNQVLALTYV
jgi:hypothetical protein